MNLTDPHNRPEPHQNGGQVSYRVLLVEDDPMVQEVNRQFVERVDGFRIIGTASNGADGLSMTRELLPDLLILDVFMPMMDGMNTLTAIRAEGLQVDVIVISAANDKQTIQHMLQNGAIDYIIKPFKFERVQQALEQFRSKKQSLQAIQNISQQQLDYLLFGHTSPGEPVISPAPASPSIQAAGLAASEELPKGLQAITLKQIVQFLSVCSTPLSAEEVAEGVGIARVTARRYLDYLEKHGQVRLDLQYGVGRPVNKYILNGK
ncbi:response regulator [Paenibacillus rigui]|uniref:Transcriptional regulatory protein n=1 Tax=Paenibacillus rigui TaxID=554312 RepID=A0A229UIQ0_9BACL|nr:response regulator [Paenibacillus rigui]OXM83260.1 two-component system response regulator [Paenibacillus rigui]